MAQESRTRDKESVKEQEQMRIDTLVYKYQLKASIKAQALEQQKAGIEDQIDRGKEYVLEALIDYEDDYETHISEDALPTGLEQEYQLAEFLQD